MIAISTSAPTIRRCLDTDFAAVLDIINDGARAYAGQIPADRLREPYMSAAELRHEIAAGVEFWGFQTGADLLAVMGIQFVQDVTLIRHAYVRTAAQKQGIGSHMLTHLRTIARGPVLIGTWADAVWAIRFYQGHGFRVVDPVEKVRLLQTYWTVPARQIETSVVLADEQWPICTDESSKMG